MGAEASTKRGRGRPRKEADPSFPKRQASREATGKPALVQGRVNTQETPPGRGKGQGNGNITGEKSGGSQSNTTQEPIGLSPEPQQTEVEIEEPSYFCLNCKGPLQKGDPKCQVCEMKLDWRGIA